MSKSPIGTSSWDAIRAAKRKPTAAIRCIESPSPTRQRASAAASGDCARTWDDLSARIVGRAAFLASIACAVGAIGYAMSLCPPKSQTSLTRASR
jgi:hypothetical protein